MKTRKAAPASHTPGPWEYEVIAGHHGVNTFDGGRIQVDYERDARLIASAPDLLLIVKAIAEQFNEGADKVYRDALSPHSDDVTLGQWINEAITKATQGEGR